MGGAEWPSARQPVQFRPDPLWPWKNWEGVMQTLTWPERVTVPPRIGKAIYWNPKTGKPVCSVGHAIRACGGDSWNENVLPEQWDVAFCHVASVLLESDWVREEQAENVNNDYLDPRQRRLVYAATWLYLGVPIDRDFPEAAELAERAKGHRGG